MKKPNYSEPMIGWNEEDFHAGVTTYGVSNYEGTARLKITTPTHPAFLPPPPSNEPEADEVAGRAPHVRRKGRVSGVTDTVSVTVDAYYSTY